MKYFTMLGSIAIVAAALAGFPGTASATVITSPPGTLYTGNIHAESEGTTTLHGSFTSVNCGKSTISTTTTSHGAGVTASGTAFNLTFSECNFPVTVLKAGSLELHGLGGGTGNATLTSSGAEITIQTSVANCIFTTSNTDLGTLTGSATTKSNATLDINAASIPRTGHSIFCGGFGTWTGSYRVWSPSSLNVH
jgi:hypothetical protein